jgi:hypothetical protein
LLLVNLLVLLAGCAQGEPISAGAVDLELPVPAPIVAAPECTIALSVAPNIQTVAERATARLTAATGCTFTRSDDGVPVAYGAMRPVVGETACGQNVNTYDTITGVVLTEEGVTIATNYQDLVSWPAASILVHELMHALINQPGQIYDGTHADSGIFASHSEPGADVLNEVSLSYFCARAACTSFAPEQAPVL